MRILEAAGLIGRALLELALLGTIWLVVLSLVLGRDPAPFPLNVLLVMLALGLTLWSVGGDR